MDEAVLEGEKGLNTDDRKLIPYSSSDDSTVSNDSVYAQREISMDVNAYDLWEDDAYYDLSEIREDDCKYQSITLDLVDKIDESAAQRPMVNDSADMHGEALEENNNDPNNNMDSIEIIGSYETAVMEQNSEASVDRAVSPRPGCSKDFLPLRTVVKSPEPPDDDVTLERTRHILRLVSKIHRDSIYHVLKKNNKIAISELKLWDLIPEEERIEYPSRRDTVAPAPKTDARNAGNGAKIAMSSTPMFPETNNIGLVAGRVKRGPADDICTVGCKKSSSKPDVAISLPKLVSSSPRSKISSISHIPQAIGKSTLLRNQAGVAYARRADNSQIKTIYYQHYNFSPAASVVVVDKAQNVNNGRGAIPKGRFDTLRRQNVAIFDDEFMHNPPAYHREMHSAARGGLGIGTKDPKESKISSNATSVTGNATGSNVPATTIQQTNQPQEKQQETKKVCMEIYYKLRNIFPNVDPQYIKNMCPPEWAPDDRDAQFSLLVDLILSKGDSLPMAPPKLPDDNESGAGQDAELGIGYGNVDDIYETLLGIFPDADPHYLRDFSETNVAKPDAVKQFVESKLEHRDYPTREQYMARLKITEQQRQYTNGFDVKQFLTIIPDPFKHFMDVTRKCRHSTVAFEFLKSHFNKIRVSTISRAYTQHNQNLSLAAAYLERTSCEMKSRRGSTEMPTEDILLLQEIAFLKHKKEINDYMENMKKAEEDEFKMLKEQNFLVECQCCFDDECVPSKCSACDNGHLFCNKCVINGTSSKMGDGETRISCFVNCGSEFSLSVLQRVLAPTTFSILLKKRQAAEVIEAGLEGLVSCPFCHFASIPPEEDKIFKCLNPECTKESCRLCKELSHVPLKCDEVMKADKARRYIEEKMTQALARKCYKCQRAFFKEEGCNKITCPCGATMCYLCDEPIKDYSHFRGQGSDAKDLCPLYSDTIRLDAVAVRKVAEQAQLEVIKLNPNVKVDTAKLLPEIPRPTHGPHTAVLNADELPIHQLPLCLCCYSSPLRPRYSAYSESSGLYSSLLCHTRKSSMEENAYEFR